MYSSFSAGDDYHSLMGSITITDNAELQCIPITIVFSSSREQDVEWFTFGISAAETFSGLTLTPAQASVYITDQNGVYYFHLHLMTVLHITLYLYMRWFCSMTGFAHN